MNRRTGNDPGDALRELGRVVQAEFPLCRLARRIADWLAPRLTDRVLVWVTVAFGAACGLVAVSLLAARQWAVAGLMAFCAVHWLWQARRLRRTGEEWLPF